MDTQHELEVIRKALGIGPGVPIFVDWVQPMDAKSHIGENLLHLFG